MAFVKMLTFGFKQNINLSTPMKLKVYDTKILNHTENKNQTVQRSLSLWVYFPKTLSLMIID